MTADDGVSMARHRLNLMPLLTHTFKLDQITAAYDLFANRKDDVLKVAIQVN